MKPRQQTQDELPKQTAIVANAARLLKDAKLLLDNERCPSAFALAVLALEEIGKVVLNLWGPDAETAKRRAAMSLHRKKQTAVSSLLLADMVATRFGDMIMGESPNEELIETIGRAMSESETGRFMRHVSIGAVDKTKQAALYYDDWFEAAGIYEKEFEATDVTDLFEKCRTAVAAIGVPRTMRVGLAIYKVSVNTEPVQSPRL